MKRQSRNVVQESIINLGEVHNLRRLWMKCCNDDDDDDKDIGIIILKRWTIDHIEAYCFHADGILFSEFSRWSKASTPLMLLFTFNCLHSKLSCINLQLAFEIAEATEKCRTLLALSIRKVADDKEIVTSKYLVLVSRASSKTSSCW